MGNALKICIVGCGRVARNHADGAKQCKDVELTAIVSRNEENRIEFKNQYGVEYDFACIADALNSGTFDAVDICLPNDLHREYAILCANAGKHILIEKPMANTLEECMDINAAVERNGVTLMVGQSRRFYDAVFKSKELLDAGKVGELISITAVLLGKITVPPTKWWSNIGSGGLILPMWGTHIIDYVMFMFGEKPNRVYCEAYSNNPAWEGEDEATLLMGYSNNRFATIKMSYNANLNKNAWVNQKAMLQSSDILYERYIQGSNGTMKMIDETHLMLNGETVYNKAQTPGNFALQYAEFASAVKERRKPLTDGSWGAQVVQVQEAALQSAKTQQVVFLD